MEEGDAEAGEAKLGPEASSVGRTRHKWAAVAPVQPGPPVLAAPRGPAAAALQLTQPHLARDPTAFGPAPALPR